MKVKICGVTHPDDIIHIANAGADYVGIIFAKQSKRFVTLKQAKELQQIAKKKQITPVAVFLEQSYDDIVAITDTMGIATIQIHGAYTTHEIYKLSQSHTVFYAISDTNANSILPFENTIPLFDNQQPGSGKSFDWSSFTPPIGPWILAGGLNIHNVEQALQLFTPSILDVASSVEYENNIRKNPILVTDFINKIKKR